MSLFGKCNPCCRKSDKPPGYESPQIQLRGFCRHIDGHAGCYGEKYFYLYPPQTQLIDPWDGVFNEIPLKSLWQPYGGIASATNSVPGHPHHREYCRIYDPFDEGQFGLKAGDKTIWDIAVETLGYEPEEIHFRGTARYGWKMTVDFGYGSEGRCISIGAHWPDYEPPLDENDKPYIPFLGASDVTKAFTVGVGVAEFEGDNEDEINEDAARAALKGFPFQWEAGGELTLPKDAASPPCGKKFEDGTIQTIGDAPIDFDVTAKFKSLRFRDSPLHIGAKVTPNFSALSPIVYGWKYCNKNGGGLLGNGPFGHAWSVWISMFDYGFVGVNKPAE